MLLSSPLWLLLEFCLPYSCCSFWNFSVHFAAPEMLLFHVFPFFCVWDHQYSTQDISLTEHIFHVSLVSFPFDSTQGGGGQSVCLAHVVDTFFRWIAYHAAKIELHVCGLWDYLVGNHQALWNMLLESAVDIFCLPECLSQLLLFHMSWFTSYVQRLILVSFIDVVFDSLLGDHVLSPTWFWFPFCLPQRHFVSFLFGFQSVQE